MKLIVISSLITLAAAGSLKGFRYAYSIPQESEQQPWSQFNERTGTNYAWGYEFPGQVHYESRDDGGNVRGSFGFVDANGYPNVWKYSSDPKNGMNVEIGISENLPQATQSEQEPQAESEAIFYSGLEKSRREQFAEVLSDNPLLKSALLSRHVMAAGSSPFSGMPQFAVDPEYAKEAESVSSLAVQFNAIPVAAVHDVQMRPSYASQSASSPLLNYKELPDATLYSIELPDPIV